MLSNDVALKLNEVVEATTNCIELSVGKDFDVTTVVKLNPKDSSMATVNNVIKMKGARGERQLSVVIDIDKKTSLCHVMILNVERFNTNILFTATEEDPVQKIEKYLPNIINSTQNMLMTQIATRPEKKKVYETRNRSWKPDSNRGRERNHNGRRVQSNF